MSKRESIAANILTTLEAVSQIKYVTRDPFDFKKLSSAQFPAVLIQTSREDRVDVTISSRESTIDYLLVGYVKDGEIDTARNQIVEYIEESLDVDRTRGGNAIDTQVITVEVDDGTANPIGGVLVTVRVLYNFIRGSV